MGTVLGLVCVLPAGAASADLPPLLEFLDGSTVKTPADWDRRREEINGLMTRYFTGTVPALVPRLGLFQDRPASIPYDFQDLLRLIAPRPCLIVSPRRDRDADVDDVLAAVGEVRSQLAQSGRVDRLTHRVPDDVNRFQSDQHRVLIDWLRDAGF